MIPFRPLFSKSVYQRALVLLVGALLAAGAHTVTAALRMVGGDQNRDFEAYHRVLSRAVRSSREAVRLLLFQLISRFVPEGPLVFGIDDMDWHTLYAYFNRWSLDGTLERIYDALHQRWRKGQGRRKTPSAAILDSQSARPLHANLMYAL